MTCSRSLERGEWKADISCCHQRSKSNGHRGLSSCQLMPANVVPGRFSPEYSRGLVSAKHTLYGRQSVQSSTLSISRTQGQHWLSSWTFPPAGQGKHNHGQISTAPPVQFVLTYGGSSTPARGCLRATQAYCDVDLPELRPSWWELDESKAVTFNLLLGEGEQEPCWLFLKCRSADWWTDTANLE